MPTVQETFEAMAGRFKVGAGPGAQGGHPVRHHGTRGCTYHVDIADGQCAVREGGAAQPA